MSLDEQLLYDAKGHNKYPSENTKCSNLDVFLLTKPPCSERARLCLRLIKQSKNAVLYLSGDGVYCLLGKSIEALPRDRILACKEDLLARGVQAEDKATIPVNFYERLVEDAMNRSSRIYTF